MCVSSMHTAAHLHESTRLESDLRRRVSWTVFSTHGLVLLHVARKPEAPVREIAAELGLSPRQVNKVLNDLESGRMLTRTRVGRGNRYTVDQAARLRHPSMAHVAIGGLIDMLNRAG
jgi:DNA-binding MarR family transcriptional regulator